MQQYHYTEPKVPDGYKSADSKNKFLTYVITLVVILFVVQMGLPFVLMIFMGPMFMFSTITDMRVGQIDRGAFYRGCIWYTETNLSDGPKLKRLHVTGGSKPETVCDIPMGDVWLLSDKDRMWIVSRNGLLEYRDGKISEVFRKKIKAEISRPFFYKGHPAMVVEAQSHLFRIRYFDKGQWQDGEEFELIDESESGCYSSVSNIQVLNCNDKLYLFHRQETGLYCFEGIPNKGDNLSGKWESVGKIFGGDWTTTCFKDSPTVIMGDFPAPFQSPKIKAVRKNGEQWEEIFKHKVGIVTNIGVFHSGKGDDLYLLAGGFPGSYRLLSIKGNKIIKDDRFGKRGFSPFPPIMVGMMIFFNILIAIVFPLAIIMFISKWIKQFRIIGFSFKERQIQYAPLWKRAVAKIIDSAIFYAPAVIVYLYFIRAFFNFEIFFPFELPSHFFLMILGVILWSALILFVFSYMEGSSGQTPGKRIMKIKVLSADDLENCGFLRALGRNIAMVVDGMFHSLVGILMIAFTGRYQRLGDMLGSTIVVDCEEQKSDYGERRTENESVGGMSSSR
ncbi:MAG: RDD family protein [Candidatus Eremiobacteraeota bacterium]|nr:RDD family protein [Candidatus Eremiobacteraeota bacterium]